MNALIGRDEDIDALCGLLTTDGARLVFLTGPGGIGKTSLARQVAKHLESTFSDGTVLVGLTEIDSVGLIADAIANELKLPDWNGDDAIGRVTDYLGDRSQLIVLDNFEHLAEGDEVIAEILARTSSPRFLVTSRVQPSLHRLQAAVYSLSALEVPSRSDSDLVELADIESVTLFCREGQKVRAGFQLTPANAGAVSELCRRLDGLPLAIELAAAQTAVLSPANLLEKLDSGLELLESADESKSARHRSLSQTLRWSYESLTQDQQSLLKVMAIHDGTSTLQSLASVGNCCFRRVEVEEEDSNQRTISDLSVVAAHRLATVVEGENGAYRFRLHELIKAFLLTELEQTGEYEDAANAHCHYFVDLAELAHPFLRGPKQRDWVELLEDDLPNLHAAFERALRFDIPLALRLAGALGPFWSVRGRLAMGQEWLRRALQSVDGTANSGYLIRALAWSGWIANARHEFALGETLLAEGLERARVAGLRNHEAEILHHLGVAAVDRMEPSIGLSYHRQALALWRKFGDSENIIAGLNAIGVAIRDLGDPAAARLHYLEALDLARAEGNAWREARLLHNLAEALWDMGLTDDSAQHYLNSLKVFRSLGDLPGVADCCTWIGCLAGQAGEYRSAARMFGCGSAIFESVGVPGVDKPARPRFDQHLARSREALGETEFLVVFRSGKDLSLQAAADEAEFTVSSLRNRLASSIRFQSGLSRREIEVLRLVVLGKTDREIGEELYVTRRTAAAHVANILAKLQVSSRTAAAAEAVRRGWC